MPQFSLTVNNTSNGTSGTGLRDNVVALSSALMSSNSGATEPSYKVTGTLWYDTVNNKLKHYDQNGFWIDMSFPVGFASQYIRADKTIADFPVNILQTSDPLQITATAGTFPVFLGTGTRVAQVTPNTAFNRNFETSTANIKMNGSVLVGTSGNVARADHVHPTDTTRAPLASPAFTGTPTAPTAAEFTNTTQVATTAFVTRAVNRLPIKIAVFGSFITTASPSTNGTIVFSSSGNIAFAEYTYQTITAPTLTNNTTFTVPNNGGGFYRLSIVAKMYNAVNATGFYIRPVINGVASSDNDLIFMSANSTTVHQPQTTRMSGATVLSLNGGDTVYLSSGSTPNNSVMPYSGTRLTIERVGP